MKKEVRKINKSNNLSVMSMSDITLKCLQEFYSEELMNSTYVYEYEYLDNLVNNTPPKIHLDFYEANMCHLLGIQHIVDNLYNKNTYTGELGYNKIKNNEMSIEILKSISKTKFKSQKDRFKFFKCIKDIIEEPDLILYNSNNNNSKIKSKYIMYKLIGNSYVHLGIDLEDNSDRQENSNNIDKCFPRTFLIEKNMKKKFIDDQTKLRVKKTDLIPK